MSIFFQYIMIVLSLIIFMHYLFIFIKKIKFNKPFQIEFLFFIFLLISGIYTLNFQATGLSNIENVSVNFRIIQRALMIVIAVMGIVYLISKKRKPKSLFKFPYFLLLLVTIPFFLSSVFYSGNLFYSLARLLEYISIVVFLSIVIDTYGITKTTKTVLLYVSLITYFQPIIGILFPTNVFYISGDETLLGFQLFGILPVLNANGYALNVTVLLAAKLTSFYKAKNVYINWIEIVLLLLMLAATYSRSSIISFIMILLLYIFSRNKNKIILSLKSLVIVSLPFITYLSVDTFYKIMVRGNEAQLYSMSGRIYYWEKAWEVFLSNPIFGSGYAYSTRYLVMAEMGHESISTLHNTYMEILINGGIVAMILYGFVFFSMFKFIFKSFIQYKIDNFYLLFMLLILFKSFTNTIGVYSDNFLYFGLLIGYLTTLNYKKSIV